MFSMEALRQVQVEFCRGLSKESMLDSMRIEILGLAISQPHGGHQCK